MNWRLNFPPQFIASIANNGIKNDAIERLSTVHQIRIDEYCGRRNSRSPHKFQVRNRRVQSMESQYLLVKMNYVIFVFKNLSIAVIGR